MDKKLIEQEMQKFDLVLNARAKLPQMRKEAGIPEIERSGKTKKILGICFGKKNGNTELAMKAAAVGAAEYGMEFEMISAHSLTVKPCIACNRCTPLFFGADRLPNCGLKDDLQWIMQKAVVEDNAIILATPCLHLMPNSLEVNCVQRMHQIMFTYYDCFFNVKKVGAMISVGSGTDGWMSLSNEASRVWLEHIAVLVDEVTVEDSLRDIDWAERCKQLGRNVAQAMLKPIDEVSFMGDKHPYACPVCNCKVMLMQDYKPRTPEPGELRYKPGHVLCSVCGTHGTFRFEGEELKVDWNQWDIDHARCSDFGNCEHTNTIMRRINPAYPECREHASNWEEFKNVKLTEVKPDR